MENKLLDEYLNNIQLEAKDVNGNKVLPPWKLLYEKGIKIYNTVEKIEKKKNCEGTIKSVIGVRKGKTKARYVCHRLAGIKGAIAGINYIQSVKCPQYKNPKTTKFCLSFKKDILRDWHYDIRILKAEIRKVNKK